MYKFRVRCIEVDESEKGVFTKGKIYSDRIAEKEDGSALFNADGKYLFIFIDAENGMQSSTWDSKFRLVTAQNGTAS